MRVRSWSGENIINNYNNNKRRQGGTIRENKRIDTCRLPSRTQQEKNDNIQGDQTNKSKWAVVALANTRTHTRHTQRQRKCKGTTICCWCCGSLAEDAPKHQRPSSCARLYFRRPKKILNQTVKNEGHNTNKQWCEKNVYKTSEYTYCTKFFKWYLPVFILVSKQNGLIYNLLQLCILQVISDHHL